jgi:radical SAM superfamily enzyme YgiQ (UPF0313 family)
LSVEAGIVDFGAGSSHLGKRSKRSLGQGTHIVRQCCLRDGHRVRDLHGCEQWSALDVVMVGLYWWEHAYDLVLALAQHGIEPDRLKRGGKPLVFVGGQLPSYNPSVLSAVADLVCVGDGEEVAPEVLRRLAQGAGVRDLADVPGVYVSAIDNRAQWQHVDDIGGTVRWPFYNRIVETHESGVRQTEVFERRLEIARGCRSKCAYCGVSWTKRYRELPTDAVCRVVGTTPGSVKAFAPDPRAHSGWPEIEGAYTAAGKHNQARDISTKMILQRGLGTSRIYHVGIDGLSERLRAAVHKPLARAQLVDVIERVSGHGGQIQTYQILDLPGEKPEDYVEWFEDLARVQVRERPASGRFVSGDERDFYVVVGLNAFCPTPHTPLQWEGIRLHPECWERYRHPLNAVLGDKAGRRLKHKVLGRPHGSVSRLLEAAILRGDVIMGQFLLATAAVRQRFASSAQVWHAARRLGLEDALRDCVRPHSLDETLPWERRVAPLFPRAALARAAVRFRNAVGSAS